MKKRSNFQYKLLMTVLAIVLILNIFVLIYRIYSLFKTVTTVEAAGSNRYQEEYEYTIVGNINNLGVATLIDNETGVEYIIIKDAISGGFVCVPRLDTTNNKYHITLK